ncbi:MAG: DUF882 domain-containing protein [Nitrospina sp.]|nr:DUF882 domain-containing protein [Nitrospina sp.]
MLVILLTAIAGAPSKADAETRSLKLYYLHTGEKAIIAFKKDGKYIPSGLQKMNQFLRDWRHNEPTKMDPHLLDLVWEVYRQSGSKDYIHVISGYRSPATNSMLRKRGHGVAKYSQHMLGKAMDFFLPDVKLATLRELGLKAGVGGVGFYPTSGSPFVHLDTGNVRHWPRMSRTQLAKVFPNGGTLHIPSDGKPLPGYEAALASYKARKENGTTAFSVASADTGKDKKKTNLLGRLFASSQQEEEEDEEANSVPAPRTVATTSTGAELRPVELTAAPADDGQASREQLESGTPMQIVPDEQELIELARVPIPTRRPDHAQPALVAEQVRPLQQVPSENPVIAALTPDDIEKMRRAATPSPRPSSLPGASLTAYNGESVEPTVARSAVLEALNAKRPIHGNIPAPDTSPLTVASIMPSPDPRRAAAPRTLELALAATETRSNSAGEAIRSLIEADNRLRQHAGLDVGNIRPTQTGLAADRNELRRLALTMPVSRESLSAPAQHRTAPGTHATNWEQIGATALAGFQPIEYVNYIRAPAYGMGMMRETPREILSAGFVQTAFVQPTRHFSSIANAIPIFTRYTD